LCLIEQGGRKWQETWGKRYYVLALFFGVITALLLGQYLRKQAEGKKENWLPVVVASQDIGSRVKITGEMVRIEHYPKEFDRRRRVCQTGGSHQPDDKGRNQIQRADPQLIAYG